MCACGNARMQGGDSALARVQGGVANYFLCIAPSEEEESAKGNKESITTV